MVKNKDSEGRVCNVIISDTMGNTFKEGLFKVSEVSVTHCKEIQSLDEDVDKCVAPFTNGVLSLLTTPPKTCHLA